MPCVGAQLWVPQCVDSSFLPSRHNSGHSQPFLSFSHTLLMFPYCLVNILPQQPISYSGLSIWTSSALPVTSVCTSHNQWPLSCALCVSLMLSSLKFTFLLADPHYLSFSCILSFLSCTRSLARLLGFPESPQTPSILVLSHVFNTKHHNQN